LGRWTERGDVIHPGRAATPFAHTTITVATSAADVAAAAARCGAGNGANELMVFNS